MTVFTQLLLGLFFIAHGLIHASYAAPHPADATTWPFELSRSWLLNGLGLGEPMIRPVGTLLWVVATAGFVLVGLGVFGIVVPQSWWLPLAVVASAASLLLLVLYWHPWLVLGVVIDVVLLAALLVARWSPLPTT